MLVAVDLTSWSSTCTNFTFHHAPGQKKEKRSNAWMHRFLCLYIGAGHCYISDPHIQLVFVMSSHVGHFFSCMRVIMCSVYLRHTVIAYWLCLHASEFLTTFQCFKTYCEKCHTDFSTSPGFLM